MAETVQRCIQYFCEVLNIENRKTPINQSIALPLKITDKQSYYEYYHNEQSHRLNRNDITAFLNTQSENIDYKSTTTKETHNLDILNDYGISHEDVGFVIKVLKNLTTSAKEMILEQYCQLWIETYKQNVNNLIKRENIARRKANIWLREYTEEEMK